MKSILNKVFILSVLAVFSLGCEEVLETEPTGFASAEVFYQTEDDLVIAINGIYNTFQGDQWGGAFVHLQPHFDGATENAVVAESFEYGFPQVANGTMSAANTFVITEWKWNYGYEAISRINAILDILDAGTIPISAENEAKLRGEARFLRAFVYTELITLYGDVPLILAPIAPEDAENVTRTDKNTVLEAIVEDFDFAAANLETTPNRGEVGRPTLQTALAYQGRVLLYNQQYAAATAALQQVIALEGDAVNLDPNYESLFNASNEASNEILFSIQYTEGSTGEGSFVAVHYAPNIPGNAADGFQSVWYTQKLLDAYYMTDGLPFDESPLYDPAMPFENRDPRLNMTFYLPGDQYRDVVLDSINIGRTGFTESTPEGFVPFSLRKWINDSDEALGAVNSQADLVLMRYADVLLMYAEAQNEASGPDASVYSAINKVRARAGMPEVPAGLSQEQMRQTIRHERNVEFIGEGLRYYDLLRWRIADTVIPSIPELDARVFDPAVNYLWPIPQSAIDQSPGIEQNPGY